MKTFIIILFLSVSVQATERYIRVVDNGNSTYTVWLWSQADGSSYPKSTYSGSATNSISPLMQINVTGFAGSASGCGFWLADDGTLLRAEYQRAGSAEWRNMPLNSALSWVLRGQVQALKQDLEIQNNLQTGTHYYVSNAGSDSANGTSTDTPWQTVSKVNTVTFSPGDTIHFKRGDTWIEGLDPKTNAGSPSASVTFSDYGSGLKPIITGFSNITSWVNINGNIWESASDFSGLSTCQSVSVNGNWIQRGRYPVFTNACYAGTVIADNTTGFNVLKVDNPISGVVSNIGSAQLNSSPTNNWIGSQVVYFTQLYDLGSATVTNQTGSNIFFNTSVDLSSTHGFMLQGHNACLLKQFDWMYYTNNGAHKLRMYSTNNPSAYTVKASCIGNLIDLTSNSWYSVQNLNLVGGNTAGINVQNSHMVTMKYCDIEKSGQCGIVYGFIAARTNTIEGCTITDSGSCGILMPFSTPSNGPTYPIVRGNVITRSGVWMGHVNGNTSAGFGYGIKCGGYGGLFEYNYIDYTGGIGINPIESNTTVQKNVVQHYDQVIADLGGIYTWSAASASVPPIYTNRFILNNFILYGGQDNMRTNAQALYSDSQSDGLIYRQNTMAYADDGMLWNYPSNCVWTESVVYDCIHGIEVSDQKNAGNISDILFTNNVFCILSSTNYIQSNTGTITPSVNQDYNTWGRPYLDSLNFLKGSTHKSLSTWQTDHSLELHSSVSPSSSNQTMIVMNPSDLATNVTLSGSWYDMSCVGGTNLLSGTITIDPWRSKALLKQ